MTIKQFIEAAIEGGWKPSWISDEILGNKNDDGYFPYYFNSRIFLDPEAWKAVGRVKRWNSIIPPLERNPGMFSDYSGMYMGRLFEALWNGSTLEEYIATL